MKETSMLERAKDELSDVTWTDDQRYELHCMLDAMAPALGASWSRRGNWPWQTGHPWRFKLGRFFWGIGYRLMHGRKLRGEEGGNAS